MKRSEVRTFIEAGVTAVDASMTFGSGRITEWNAARDNRYPGVWWESDQTLGTEITNFTLPLDSWPIRVHIGKKDAQDSSAAQYEALIDDCDLIAQKLVRQYNQILEGANENMVSISGINREPFIKKHADLITGVILSFTLSLPDTTNLC